MENNLQINSAVISDRGLSEKRPQNEDSFLEERQNGIFVVADGVGGAQAGDVASQMAVEIVGEAFADLQKGYDHEEVMQNAIERANSSIFQMSNELPQLSTMATTIVALHVDGNIATIGHVGDSRLYRMDNRGTLYRETQDHSLVEEEMRAGLLTPEQAANHPNKNIISRALGAESTVQIDLKTIMFEPDTIFLLCSDGITRHIDDFELRDLLQSNAPLSEICAQMKNICYERGAEDNLTAVIVKIVEAEISANADDSDFEQSTVATARAATAANAVSAGYNETPTQDFSAQKINLNQIQTEKNALVVDKSPERIRAINNDKSSIAFGKIFSSLILLLIGGTIGAGAYYIWVQKQLSKTEQVQTFARPTESAQMLFENKRRSVDRNPEQFIKNKEASTDNPEDLYLLGRSHLLMGNYREAKTAFTEARNRLALVDEANSRVLANEIALGLAVINNPNAQRELQRELNLQKTNANVQMDANFGTNLLTTTGNVNSPIIQTPPANN